MQVYKLSGYSMTYKLQALFSSAVFICGINIASADAAEDPMARARLEASVAFDAKWSALKDKCKNPTAPVSEDRLHSSWMEANPTGLQQLDDIIVRQQIRMGIDQAEARYPSMPPKTICAMAKELSIRKHADSSHAKNKRATGNTVDVVYRCDADGTTLYSDIKYKSVPCKAVDLPGLAPAAKAKPVTALSIAEAKQIAAYDLLDPEATRFRNLFVSRSGNVCGELNAKNAYGAYTGYTQFLVHAVTRRALIDREGKSGSIGFAYRESCAR